MKNTRKIIALLLATLMMLTLFAACKKEPAAPGTSTPGTSTPNGDAPEATTGSNSDRTLNVVAMQDSGTLHPLGVTGGFLNSLYAFYEPLYDTRADGSRMWMLATALDRISDIQYTLTIREGVTFSNGNPLTAEDVMFSMELCAADPQFALNVKVVDFEKTSVTGDYTIDLWYTSYNASQEPGFASMFIIDKESYDEVALASQPVGTGPYVVEDYVTNSHLTLSAREDYWGGEVAVKNLRFIVINEEAQIVNALETGDADIANVPIADVDYVKSLGYNVEVTNAGYNYVTMYSLLPGTPLESKEARWAVSMAINREAIIDVIYDGYSTITDYPSSHGMADMEDRYLNMHETYSTGYDPTRAAELAEQAGIVGSKLRIITNGATATNTIAEMIQADLLAIGVNAEIVNYDQATYFGTLMDASNFEIAIFTPSAPSMLAVDILAMYLTFIPLGWEGADRDLYGELSQDAIATYDAKERGEKLYEALKIFVDYDPWYGLCEIVNSRAVSADLNGVEYMIAGNLYYHNISFK